jgi:acetyl esterase/lipase
MKRVLSIGLLIVSCWSANSAMGLADERPTAAFPLWTEAAPGARGTADVDIPTLTPYWAAETKTPGSVMIVCPGGGYNHLAPHEGETYARWLNSLGIHALVLKYRLAKNGYYLPTILQDAARSVRLVRSRAESWKLNPKQIGMIGSSAGGHLTATLMTRFDAGQPDAADPIDRVSSRPDLGVLCYAFILFDRNDKRDNNKPDRQTRFLGPDPQPEQVRLFSPALNVTSETPPAFIWQTVEDTSVPPENATVFADAVRRAKVPFELHLYQIGRHGIGVGSKELTPEKLHPWTRECARWLALQGFVPSADAQ